MMIDFKNKVFEGSNKRKSLFDCTIPEGATAVIVFAHGYKGFKDWGAWGLMQKFFVENKVGFVKFNFSHNGGTVTNPIDFDDLEAFGNNRYSYELADLTVIINETYRLVNEECELDIPIYVVGHSRGGGVAILAGALSDKINGVISLAGISVIESRFKTGDELQEWERDGVYYVTNERTKQEMPHFYSFYKDFKANESLLNIEEALKSLHVPFLQIHGDMDLAVSISEGQLLAEWSDTELCIIKGAEHTFGAKHPWESKELPFDLISVLKYVQKFIAKG